MKQPVQPHDIDRLRARLKSSLRKSTKGKGATAEALEDADQICDLALRAITKKVRYVNAGEVTVWNKKVVWDSELPKHGDARLVWVNEGDITVLGQEVGKKS